MKLALPVNLKATIKLVCDMAQIEYGTVNDVKEIKNYYVLIILMAGVIDDFEESLNELLRAVNLPLSVLIVKIGGNQEEHDSNNLMTLSKHAFDKCERQFVKVLDYEHQYKRRLLTQDADQLLQASVTKFMQQKFEHDLIVDMPKQIEKFFEILKLEMEDEEQEKELFKQDVGQQ